MKLRITAVLVSIVMLLSLFSGCVESTDKQNEPPKITSLDIAGGETRSMKVGSVCLLEIVQVEINVTDVIWRTSGGAVSVDEYGIVTAIQPGTAIVMAVYGQLSDTVEITVWDKNENDSDSADGDETENEGDGAGGDETDNDGYDDPYINISKSEFYANYTPAESFIDAYYRTQHGLMSGSLEVPGQEPTEAADRPMQDGLYVRNANMRYEDGGNTYVVFDSQGNVAFKVYRGAAYITLEEVAAYMFAFGGADGAFPANYTSSKKTKPTNSEWGEYLRVNHSHFLGDTEKYPREPELPNISGCGGDLQYWEMDIGTGSYNNGNKITRGSCRLVYGRDDLDGDGVYERGELHVFYTSNHYDDFREYLNYEGGWGEIFGYETNGASAAKGPSPYVEVVFRAFNARTQLCVFCIPRKSWLCAA